MPPDSRRRASRPAIVGWLAALAVWSVTFSAWPSVPQAALDATRIAVLYVLAHG